MGVLDGRVALNTERISPLVAYLAMADCPFTGQTFSVDGGGIGIYQGWSIADDITVDDISTVADLAVAMDKLPRRVKVRNQYSMLWGDQR
jgi:hypothetical protein